MNALRKTNKESANVENKLEILMLVREARSSRSYRTYELSAPKRFICTLHVFIIIDIYIIRIYANICVQIMECLIVLINERISNANNRKDVFFIKITGANMIITVICYYRLYESASNY